jgi:intracellular septation protein
MQGKVGKNFFLISFLPAIAYWYLEEHYPIRIAIAGGLGLAILEISFEKFYLKHVHTISKFNFFLILFLGGLSLLGDDGIWFKLQPCFTGVGISSFLAYRLVKGNGLMAEMMETMNPERMPPEEILKGMEWHMVFLFGPYGIFMGGVALWGTTDQWLFWKTIGFYIVFAVFLLIEIILVKRKVRQMLKRQEQHQALSRFNRP